MPQSFAEQFKSIPMSPNLAQSLERAHRFARDQSQRLVTLEHLLLSLRDDPEAALILQSANIDLNRLGADASGYVGRLDEIRGEGAVEPRPDAELLRVLQAAASAAQQSRRRQIDGAIVLAAIVGDGKSPAAGMLKALGMTFEEAIRALQRANTQARFKPQGGPATEDESKPARGNTQLASEVQSASQSPDDFLAAARARIRQRAAVAAGSVGSSNLQDAASQPSAEAAKPPVAAGGSGGPAPDAPAPAAVTPPEAAARPSAEAPPVDAPSPADSHQEAVSSLAERLADAASQPSRPSRRPPPESRRQPPPPAGGRGPPPLRPVQPGDGPARPPLPMRSGATGHSHSGFPNQPPRAPWPEPQEPGAAARPTAAPNGSLAGPSRAHARTEQLTVPQRRRVPPQRGKGGQAERGPLVENIPHRMHVGRATSAEVRIARDKIDALIVALNGRAIPYRLDGVAARALTVRLKAPDAGFWIELASPETQWVDGASNLIHDDHAVWRWTVVPQRRGRRRLLLQVSARTVGLDGLAADSASPDRVIEVKVRGNHRQRLLRLAGWVTAALIGAGLARLGDGTLEAGLLAFKKAIGD